VIGLGLDSKRTTVSDMLMETVWEGSALIACIVFMRKACPRYRHHTRGRAASTRTTIPLSHIRGLSQTLRWLPPTRLNKLNKPTKRDRRTSTRSRSRSSLVGRSPWLCRRRNRLRTARRLRVHLIVQTTPAPMLIPARPSMSLHRSSGLPSVLLRRHRRSHLLRMHT
jgi:hypothetical protein